MSCYHLNQLSRSDVPDIHSENFKYLPNSTLNLVLKMQAGCKAHLRGRDK